MVAWEDEREHEYGWGIFGAIVDDQGPIELPLSPAPCTTSTGAARYTTSTGAARYTTSTGAVDLGVYKYT